ncbi:MAG: ribonuclease III [Clostridia bacterium]|nr:ribonuclease III [Clostridia bacterium]MBQ9994382.1 ribonuclease III [Clostridia bacterium]
MSTAALAFIGDAVYSLLVREQLCCSGRWKADVLHKRAVEMVRCKAQADAMERVMDILSDEEKAVFMRGRNSHTAHIPKHAAVADYRAATGMEALMGYLYLSGRIERVRELYLIISQEKQALS